VCPDDGTPLSAGLRADADSGWSHEPALAVAPTIRVNDLHAGTLVGEYRIEGKLGEGGMGSVYAATHPLIGKKAAIKIISPHLCTNGAAVERFVQEARAVNQIGHPNIVDVFSFGELVDGRSYFVMEWLQGETLAARMLRSRVPLPEAVEILDQISDALEAAHETHIVHRDLKPANVILVSIRGNRQLVKLLDFGLAKLAESEDNRLQKTRTGVMMGTPEYVSPEQARGKNVDHRTDLYALGVISYELLLGRLPFEADNAADIITKHLREPPPSPSSIWPEIPESLESIIVGMLEKDPARRPTLLDVRNVLAEIRSTVGAESSLGSLRPRLITPAMGSGPWSSEHGHVTPPTPLTIPVDDSQIELARPRRRWIYFLAALAGLASAAVVALVGLRTGAELSTPPLAPISAPTPAPEPQVAAPPPAPAPAPEPALGTVAISTNVSDGILTVDSVAQAGTVGEATLSLGPGSHDLVVTAPGKRREQRTIQVESGKTARVTFALKPARRSALRDDRKRKPGEEKKDEAEDKAPKGPKTDRDSLISPGF